MAVVCVQFTLINVCMQRWIIRLQIGMLFSKQSTHKTIKTSTQVRDVAIMNRNFLLMQLTPLPSNPLLHSHSKLPITSVQVAFTWQLSVSSSHSSTSARRDGVHQVIQLAIQQWSTIKNNNAGNSLPLQEYSCLWNFLLVQLTPLPSNPLLHVHTKLPVTSVQVAFTWQLSMLRSHSSMSACVEMISSGYMHYSGRQ